MELLEQLLEMMGHEVDVAYDAHEGLAKVTGTVPDVVLCDIGLPGMDELARQFRGLASNHRVRLWHSAPRRSQLRPRLPGRCRSLYATDRQREREGAALPTLLSHQIRPPCASTMSREMYRPKPSPEASPPCAPR